MSIGFVTCNLSSPSSWPSLHHETYKYFKGWPTNFGLGELKFSYSLWVGTTYWGNCVTAMGGVSRTYCPLYKCCLPWVQYFPQSPKNLLDLARHFWFSHGSPSHHMSGNTNDSISYKLLLIAYNLARIKCKIREVSNQEKLFLKVTS